jgi:predicted nucleic acid-binding Zn ribbon protein
MSDPDPQDCESCGAATLEKLLFPVAVHYKGSGFYSTDYSGKKAPASGDDSGSKTSSGDGGSSSDAGSGSSSSKDSTSSSSSSPPSSGSSD